MGRIATAVVSLIVGTAFGFVLLAGFCSIPGLAFSVACGHNAGVWLPIFLPVGIAACWLLLARIFGFKSPSTPPTDDVAVFKCSKCNAQISSDAISCPKCGFIFGSGANVA